MVSGHMAAAPPLPAQAGESAKDMGSHSPAEIANEQALVSVEAHIDEGPGAGVQSPIARLPVEMDVAIPVRDFRVRNLLNLRPGDVIETQWASGEDVPLMAGAVQLAWSEFEVIDTQLAVRVTRLA